MVTPTSQPDRRGPLFFLGNVYITSRALGALGRSGQRPGEYVARHVVGDWGEVSDADKRANDAAVAEGTRILSAYTLTDGSRLWVLTEADRSITTLLRADEY